MSITLLTKIYIIKSLFDSLPPRLSKKRKKKHQGDSVTMSVLEF